MRIIAGKHRSIVIESPKQNTRPSGDRLKESLFNTMFQQTANQVWLDLFAGSGAVGLEALSRGADHAVFCDNAQEAITCIKTNLSKVKETDKATVLHMEANEAIHSLENMGIKVDVIFCDPPYALDISQTIELLLHSSCVSDGAVLVIEQAMSALEYQSLENYTKLKERKVGKSIYRIYQLGKKE